MAAARHSDAGEADVQAKKDAEDARGHIGEGVDPTPNENYTVAGVLAGKPTPETDADHRAKVRAVTEAGR